VASSRYEIRVTGTLPPAALVDFENLTAAVTPVEIVPDRTAHPPAP
jgi:hypothetical protein